MRSSICLPVRARVVCLATSAAANLSARVTPATADAAPADSTLPTMMVTDSQPTSQIESVVWWRVTVGETVYAGGNATTARRQA